MMPSQLTPFGETENIVKDSSDPTNSIRVQVGMNGINRTLRMPPMDWIMSLLGYVPAHSVAAARIAADYANENLSAAVARETLTARVLGSVDTYLASLHADCFPGVKAPDKTVDVAIAIHRWMSAKDGEVSALKDKCLALYKIADDVAEIKKQVALIVY